jgi:hypothetical protein
MLIAGFVGLGFLDYWGTQKRSTAIAEVLALAGFDKAKRRRKMRKFICGWCIWHALALSMGCRCDPSSDQS